MQRTTLYISAAVIVLLGAVAIVSIGRTPKTPSVPPASDSASVPSLVTISPTVFNFGTIDIFGGTVSTTYTIVNQGDKDVHIIDAYTSCMCTTGVIDGLRFGMHGKNGGKVVLPAHSSTTLTALFDPLAHGPNGTGAITRELFLKTDSITTPQLRARFTGIVVKNQ